MKEVKQIKSGQCPLVDGTHNLWNCSLFRNTNANDWYAAVRRQRLCYGCLGKGQALRRQRSEEATLMLRMPRQRTSNQRTSSQWMHQETQPIATLRKPNGRGQSRSQWKHSNNQTE